MKYRKFGRRLGAVSLSALMVAALAVPASAAETIGEKEETVYIQANADGTPREVTVETALRELGDAATIQDKTNLTDIKNTEGDEAFTLGSDGALTWDNHGADIQYEGKTDADIPVGVEVSYQLDGREISADELAGQSGHVTIRFDYENTAERTVSVDGTEYTVCVPFAAMSLAALDGAKFSHVEVTNGKLIRMGDTALAVGIAFPGLSDALALDSYEADVDVDIPEYVELSADVTDFELDFTATIFSTGLFSELDLDDLDSVDDLQDDMAKLTDASGELVDGTAQFRDGLSEFQSYLAQYLTGADALTQGAGQLSDGLTALDGQSGALSTGLDALTDGLQQINDALSGLSLGGADDSAAAAVQGIMTDAAALQTALTQLQTVLAQVSAYGGGVQTQTAAALAALNAIDPDSVDEAARQNIESARAALAAMPETPTLDCSALTASVSAAADDMQAQIMVLSAHAEGLAKMAGQLTTFQSAVGGLLTGSQTLSGGFGQYAAAVSQLSAGAAQLRQGADTLNTAGSALSTGFSALTEAGGTLADGMKTFDEEGIQSLADLTGEDLTHFTQRLKALKQADESYTNFAGLADDMTGSVRFLIETDEIKK